MVDQVQNADNLRRILNSTISGLRNRMDEDAKTHDHEMDCLRKEVRSVDQVSRQSRERIQKLEQKMEKAENHSLEVEETTREMLQTMCNNFQGNSIWWSSEVCLQELTNYHLEDTSNMLSDLMQLGERVNIIETDRRAIDALDQGMSLAEEFATSVSLEKEVGGKSSDNCSITMSSGDSPMSPLREFPPEGKFSSPHLNKYRDQIKENECQAESYLNDPSSFGDRLITMPSYDPRNFPSGAELSPSHLDSFSEGNKEEDFQAETDSNKSSNCSITTPSDVSPPGDVPLGAEFFLSHLDRNEHMNSHSGNLDVSVEEHLSDDKDHSPSTFPLRESFRSPPPLSAPPDSWPFFPRHVFKGVWTLVKMDVSYSLPCRLCVLFALLSGIVVLACVLNYPFIADGTLDSYWDNLPSDVRRQRLYRCCVDHWNHVPWTSTVVGVSIWRSPHNPRYNTRCGPLPYT